jgi:hypothetical protein
MRTYAREKPGARVPDYPLPRDPCFWGEGRGMGDPLPREPRSPIYNPWGDSQERQHGPNDATAQACASRGTNGILPRPVRRVCVTSLSRPSPARLSPVRAEYGGLWSLTTRRVAKTARQAGVVWVVVLAVFALPWVEPWRDAGWDGVSRWAAALFIPAAVVVLGSFGYHWVREAIGRTRVRPTVTYNEGMWWLCIEPREVDGSAGFRCEVLDEDGATASYEFSQDGRSEIIVWFPDKFDVAGMKAGRKQPWGTYEATWEVLRPGHRTMRATVAFDWHISRE